MPCYGPIEAYQLDSGRIVFAERGAVARVLKLACGQCIGCRLDRSRQWAIRCMHEAQCHAHSSFVTLTYADDRLPANRSLLYRDYQCFMRRLRKKFRQRIRFYMAGEYGERLGRPHFHACLFGVFFDDREYFRTLPSGSKIFRSAVLDELWTHGYTSVGDVTFESAAYVARYICKKVTGPDAARHYERVDLQTGEVYQLAPEFCRMSLKPGIGFEWFAKFRAEVFPNDYCIVRGRKVKVPRYYKQLLKLSDGFMSDEIDFARVRKAESYVDDCSEARLVVREKVARARLKFKQRDLED